MRILPHVNPKKRTSLLSLWTIFGDPRLLEPRMMKQFVMILMSMKLSYSTRLLSCSRTFPTASGNKWLVFTPAIYSLLSIYYDINVLIVCTKLQ